MKKILCIIVACIMATVFVSASDVSAASVWGPILQKNTDWDTKVVAKLYVDGEYVGAGVGQGITRIYKNHVEVVSAVFVDSAMMEPFLDFFAVLNNYTYNRNSIISTQCDIDYGFFSYSGFCKAEITIKKGKIIKGTITFTDNGDKVVITLKGEKLGKFTSPIFPPE